MPRVSSQRPAAAADSVEPAAQREHTPIPGGDSIDLDSLRRAVQKQQERYLPAAPRAAMVRIPEVMDDYVRNFLIRNAMRETLEVFDVEWYTHYGTNSVATGTAVGVNELVPDNYHETAALLNRVDALEQELRQHAELTTKLTQQWMQAKKDRDFHRTSHGRVVQENHRLERLLRQARKQAENVDPALELLRQRCESLLKAKSLASMERDEKAKTCTQLEKQVAQLQAEVRELSHAEEPRSGKPGGAKGANGKKTAARGQPGTAEAKTFTWPADRRTCAPPAAASGVADASSGMDAGGMEYREPMQWTCQSAFLAHTQAVTQVAVHPSRAVVASCSDDGGWRLSALPGGEAIVTGVGHANWVSSIAIHHTGTLIATGSGDKSVKLWSMRDQTCAATLLGHTDGVWSVDFQETGELVASGGLDEVARVWDVAAGQCRQVLRGHTGAVNSARWLPFTNTLLTGSADKTISLWDARMGRCALSLYGHQNAILCVAPPSVSAVRRGISAQQLLSSDADGVVKLWDLRTAQTQLSVSIGSTAANAVAMDGQGRVAAVACDDGAVRMIDLTSVEDATAPVVTLSAGANGHTDAVLSVAFDDAANNYLVSGGSDQTVRYWSAG